MQQEFKIVMLVSNGASSKIVYHALKNNFNIVNIIVEESVSKKKLIKNRIKRLGYMKVFGQVLFILFNKVFYYYSQSRIMEIKHAHALNDGEIVDPGKINIESINDDEVITILQNIQPDAVVVNGTRIISKRVIESIKAPFLNTHAGITPAYRGVHGGYWALVQDDMAHCGVTIHIVDSGIDTGNIVYQDTIEICKQDSFNTYHLLQLAKAIPLLKQALMDIGNDALKIKTADLPSKLWYHPTLLVYIYNYIGKGIK